MAKSYKNFDEFIKINFPCHYRAEHGLTVESNIESKNENSNLQDPIDKLMADFNETIDKIIKGEDEGNKSS